MVVAHLFLHMCIGIAHSPKTQMYSFLPCIILNVLLTKPLFFICLLNKVRFHCLLACAFCHYFSVTTFA